MFRPSSRISILLFLGLLTIVMIGLNGRPTAAAAEARAELISADANALQFQLNSAEAIQTADGTINVAGLEARISEAGAPALPFYSTYIALPPAADVRVTVNESGVSSQSVEQVRPVEQVDPNAQVDFTEVSSLEEVGVVYLPDAEIYEADAVYPAQSFTVSEPMYLRDLRVVQVSLFPVRYNPVAGELILTEQMSVDVAFSGANLTNLNPLDSTNLDSINLINPAQANGWRSLPANVGAPSDFPINRDTFRIEVNADGIHEVSFASLQGAGMTAGASISSLEMSYRGDAVAFEVIDSNNNGTFEGGDKIRFFGWEYVGERSERMFVVNNYFYLWANGTRRSISNVANGNSGTAVDTWQSEITFEEDLMFYITETADWDKSTFENPADAWYWMPLEHNVEKQVALTLPDPVASADNSVSVTAEFLPNNQASNAAGKTHSATIALNDSTPVTRNWTGEANVNAVQTVAQDTLNSSGSNTLSITTQDQFSQDIALNRITVSYERMLKAVNDQLLFTYDTTGAQNFQVTNFSEGSSGDVHVWDVTDRLNPVIVTLAATDVVADGGTFTYQIKRTSSADFEMLVATSDSIVTTTASDIVRYNGASLEPSGGSAEWLAITYDDPSTSSDDAMMNSVRELATYRASTSGMKTHVVNALDIYEQYGFGFASPDAIKQFLAHGLQNWGLQYVTIVGNASYNPLKRSCTGSFCPANWNTTDETSVITPLVFEDHFSGIVPSDFEFTLLSGSDLLPDLAISRIVADRPYNQGNQRINETQIILDKIKLYESNILSNPAWRTNFVWIADNTDEGGNFCVANDKARTDLGAFAADHPVFCLDDYIAQHGSENAAKPIMRSDFINRVAQNDVSIINYRGHGSVRNWASGLLTSADVWQNTRPFFIVSADCLDGNFASMGVPSLSETFMAATFGGSPTGSAAHWSSAGLGFLSQHDILQGGFYDGMYEQELPTVGDVVNYAKVHYLGQQQSPSEAYAFILQGDAAMKTLAVGIQQVFIPILER